MSLARPPPCFCLLWQPLRGPTVNEEFHRNVLQPEAQKGVNASLPLWWEIELHKERHLKGFLSARSQDSKIVIPVVF